MDDAVQVGLFGAFSVRVGEEVVPEGAWRLRKAKSLVKLLALAPERRVHRELAIELLWPERAPEAAANNFHQALFVARRALEAAGAEASAVLPLRDDMLVCSRAGEWWSTLTSSRRPSCGSGKSRVALEAAAARVTECRDGVWVVELAGLSDPGFLADETASALGLTLPSRLPALEGLGAQLARWRALLILDNCEHLIGACAVLAEHLLGVCPGLRILATSREPLRVPGEVPTLRRAHDPQEHRQDKRSCAAGALTGNRRLKNEGRVDEAKGSAKSAVDMVTDSLTGRNRIKR